ncbi:UNVERIFIED_CONTAM: hypothetical protein FKN15_023534 [Acipenser sinensis]
MATGGEAASNVESRASNFAHSGAGRNSAAAPGAATPASPSLGLHREPMYNWQATKSSVKERFAFLFNNELLSDVRFIVGKGRLAQRIPAHKFVLAAGSAVFDAMFNGGMATTSTEIDLPDVEAAAFLALLRFLYSDEVHIGPETVMTTLYTAKKYAVPALEAHCVDFLTKHLRADNAFMLLTQARLFDEPQLASLCLDTIDKSTGDAVSAEGFTDIDLDEVHIGPETVMTTLYTAKKYAVPALEAHCVDFLTKHLRADNAFMLLTQARLFDEPQLASLCLDTIDKSTGDAVSAEGFTDIDLDTLCAVLERDTLGIRESRLFAAVVRWAEAECYRQELPLTSENKQKVLGKALALIRFPLMTVEEFAADTLCAVLERDTLGIRESRLFAAVVRWAEAECYRQELPLTSENKQKVLGKALALIRFPLMTVEEFAAGPAQSGILFDREVVNLFLHFTVNPKPRVDYIDRPRCCLRGKECSINRFQQVESRWGYSGTSDRIRFTVSRRISIVGFGLYGSIHGPTDYQVNIQIIESDKNQTLGQNDTGFSCDGTANTFRVMFKEPIEIIPNVSYTACATLKGPDSHYGTKGLKKVIHESATGTKTCFLFFSSPGNNNGTSVEDGQIPEIIFYT